MVVGSNLIFFIKEEVKSTKKVNLISSQRLLKRVTENKVKFQQAKLWSAISATTQALLILALIVLKHNRQNLFANFCVVIIFLNMFHTIFWLARYSYLLVIKEQLAERRRRTEWTEPITPSPAVETTYQVHNNYSKRIDK